MTAFDLDAYLVRLGYDGPREPTLDVLRALQRAHPQAIPFENLDPLLDRGVRLDLDHLQAKLVRGRRGGYCFEQNILFSSALRALGFTARCLGGRVYQDRAAEAGIPARTHLLVRVDLDGDGYLADVGFGGFTPTGPLLLGPETAQDTPHEPYRIKSAAAQPDHEAFALEARLAGTWTLLYRFGLTESPPIDREVANHYVATHPDSIFRKALLVARTAPDGRHTLFNSRQSFHRPDGTVERRMLPDADALCAALADTFGIAVPDEAKLAAVFETFSSA